MPEEIGDIQLFPELRAVFFRETRRHRDIKRGAFPHFQNGTAGRGGTAEKGGRVKVEPLKKLSLPVIPDLWTSCADIRNGQQIECLQPVGSPHAVSKPLQHRGVRDIFFLGYMTHSEMVADKEGNKLGVLRGNAVTAAEFPHFLLTDFRMIPAAAFADIVKERRDDQTPGVGELRHQLRKKRKLMRVFGVHQVPEPADHLNRMLINRVHVE